MSVIYICATIVGIAFVGGIYFVIQDKKSSKDLKEENI